MYICFEGIDGSGKSTLARGIFAAYTEQQKKVILTKEPGGTPIGQQLRSVVQYAQEPLDSRSEFLLYAADRAQHYTQVLEPALRAGTIVLSDRTFLSSIAYQGYGRQLDVNILTQINAWALRDVKPDVIVYLALDPEIAYQRIHARAEQLTRFEQEKKDFFARVVHGYDILLTQYPCVIRLDARKTPEALLTECLRRLSVYEKK